MTTSIDATYFNRVRITTPGRAHLVLTQINKRLRDDERAAVSEVLEEALEASALAVDLAGARRAQGSATYGEASRELDRRVDIATGVVYRTLRGQQQLHEGEAAGDKAGALLDALFPRGLAAVTNLPYPDQLGALQRLLRKAKESPHAEQVASIVGLGDTLDELAKRTDAFRGALDKDVRDQVSYREVQAATREADVKLRYVVMLLMVLHRANDDDSALRRATLLEPYTRQMEDMRRRRSRSVPVGDVDPATGDLLDEFDDDNDYGDPDAGGGGGDDDAFEGAAQ